MRFNTCFPTLAATLSLAFALLMVLTPTTPAFAQPAAVPDAAACQAEEASLERDIDLARSRGQMLRRQQLAEALNAVQARCKAPAPAGSRAARIDKLEQDIRSLRTQLERAEDQLRQLKNESP
jgi:parvulin-like peptidyl-prolyl isomerase